MAQVLVFAYRFLPDLDGFVHHHLHATLTRQYRFVGTSQARAAGFERTLNIEARTYERTAVGEPPERVKVFSTGAHNPPMILKDARLAASGCSLYTHIAIVSSSPLPGSLTDEMKAAYRGAVRSGRR